MNQGRIWCVVHPTVGLPLLIGSVAVTSLIVHYSVLSHVPWMSNYWTGGFKKTAMNGDAPVVGQSTSAFTVSVAPSTDADGKATSSVVVTLTPNPAPRAIAPLKVGDAGVRPPDPALAAN